MGGWGDAHIYTCHLGFQIKWYYEMASALLAHSLINALELNDKKF